ncbi:MAG: hypothetical protein R3326_02215 [Gemmatimonadota bacterium]|nr:hypothetical protein [Gemmatimonadota bacterium]
MPDIANMRFRWPVFGVVGIFLLAVPVRAQDADLSRALEGYDPALRPVGELVVRADFDADGDLDAAAVATDGRDRAFLVLEADERAWRVHPLYARLPDTPVRLRLVPPGTRRVLGGKGTIELASPGVELVFPGRSSALYVYENGKWRVHGTENY